MQKMRMILAAIAVLLSAIIMGTNGQNKDFECCKVVSTKEITSPITGFRLQRKNFPCIKAVIFFTAEGPKCSHWRERWVREKLEEIRKQQGFPMMNSTISTPLQNSTNSQDA